METANFMHKGLKLRSKQEQSAQGAVHFVRGEDGLEKIIKVYPKKEFKSYRAELKVLQHVREIGAIRDGFPEIISVKENSQCAEILMEALGPNLRKLRVQCSKQ